jgi:hypothetical protein
MHRMTPEERGAFQKWRAAYTPAQCLVCRSDDPWVPGPGVAFIPDYDLDTRSVEQGMSVIVLTCRRCGLILHFNAGTVLGIS